MNLTDMNARFRRLEKLAAGLAKEASLWKKCDAPVIFGDRQAYIDGILDAVSGLEGARVALAKMIRDAEERSKHSR
jgi:hypothetical protein